jgi:hypothetical protein
MIDINNKELLRKIIKTLVFVNKYRNKLNNFRKTINCELNTDSESLKALRTDLLFHFTNLEKAKSIVNDGFIKTDFNKNKYIAFSELSLFEVGTLTDKGQFGFGFFKDDLVLNYQLISPLAVSKRVEDHFSKELANLPAKFQVDKTKRDSINFTIYDEIRSFDNISLKDCIFFLRNDLNIGEDTQNRLSEYAILQFPYTPNWISYFLDRQKWSFNITGNYLQIADDRATGKDAKDLFSLEVLIAEIQKLL